MMKSTFATFQTVMIISLLAIIALPGAAQAVALPLASVPGVDGEYYHGQAMESGSPVTLQSRFYVDTKAGFDALKGAHLAGLSVGDDAPPTALSLVWTEDTSGWFPVWAVLLQSDAGLLPKSPAPKQGPAFVADSQYISVHTVRPEIGHEYSAELSYDPDTGEIVVGLTDLTAGMRLFAKTYNGQPSDGAYVPAVGAVGSGHDLQFTQLEAAAYRVPFSVPLDLLITEEGKQNRLTLYRLAHNSELFARFSADGAGAAGTFILKAVQGDHVTPLISQPGTDLTAETVVALDNAKLPLGEVELQLQYVDQTGKSWLLGSKSLQLVAANLSLRYGSLAVGNGQLQGVVTIQSEDETLDAISYELLATIANPDEKEGQTVSVGTGTLAQLGNAPQRVEFSVPMPDNREVFSLLLDIDFETPVGKITTGNQYHVVIVD